jgi:nuclear receptor co-repressor 1
MFYKLFCIHRGVELLCSLSGLVSVGVQFTTTISCVIYCNNNVFACAEIPAQVSKCCSACFNRISRRLAPHLQDSAGAQGEDGDHSSSQQLRWTEEEMEAAKCAIREHGMNWAKVAEKVGSNKTQHQCKNFYFNYRKKLGLDSLVQEYNKVHFSCIVKRNYWSM